ncbi:hypothetical protein ABZ897_35705 [Nonomuraea sp. NPDC046802]|uniref:hypothetical protein n=1 Tax=Nonomuraea sp. NPDC046802 TaxID=3154919 RepID=UPI0033C315AD
MNTVANPPKHLARTSRYAHALTGVAILHVAALLFQAVTAGLLLSSPGGRSLHMTSGIALVVIGLVHVVLAVLAWRPGGGSGRYIAPAALLLVMTVVAAALGAAGIDSVHVPLGVLLFGGGVIQVFRLRSSPRAA